MASDQRSQYPYLPEEDWNRYKTMPEKLESLNDFKKTELEEKLENFSLSENKLKEKCPPQSHASDALRLVIIGKTGQGKSATANTILGKVRFEENNTATSVTRESRRITELVDGRKISVMDTPGLLDTNQSRKRTLKELAKITTLFPDGVHAFLYVMSTANPRFTAEDEHVLDLIEKTFGGNFKNYCLLVYSHGDSALKDEDLDTYRKKQMAIGQATSGNQTQQYDRQDSRGKEQEQEQNSLAKFIDEIAWKMLAIDNKSSIPFEKERNRKEIVAMVDRMRTLNSQEIYTNDMFLNAQQEREAMKLKGLKKGWDPSIMSKVETILAANPDISREQLQAEVRRQLQVEKEERLEKEQREMQERRERELLQQQEFERKKQFEREEHEKRAKEIQLQKEEWEKHQKKEKEDFEMLQKQKEEKWKRKFNEDQQRRRKRKEEEQERNKSQEEERKQFELRQRQEREHRLREMEEFERRRQEQLKRDELEREERWKREDMEREREWQKKQEEQQKAEQERRQERKTEEHVNDIADEHMRLWEKAFYGILAYVKKMLGW